MKLTFAKATLADALGDVAPAIPSRTPKEILQNVFIRRRDGVVRLFGSNLDLDIARAVEPLTGDGEGEILLPFAKLRQVLSACGEDVELICDSQSATLKSGRSKFRLLAGGLPQDFPLAENPLDELDTLAKLDGAALAAALKLALKCVGETSRYALGGVIFVSEKDCLRLYGTNTSHVVACHVPAVSVLAGKRVSLPEISSQAFAGLAEGAVTLFINENRLAIQCEGVVAVSRLLEGSIPRLEQAVEQTAAKFSGEIQAGALAQALQTAQVFTTAESEGADFFVRNDVLAVRKVGGEIGESEVEIGYPHDSPEEAEFTLGLPLLRKFVGGIPADKTIRFGYNGENAASITFDGVHYGLMEMATRGGKP